MTELNKNFKEDRKELGLSQQDVAVLLGTSRVTYLEWEKNPNRIPLGKYELLLSEFKRLRELKEQE